LYVCLLLILSNKLDLNQETRFTIHGLPRMKNPYQFGPFICIRPIRLQKRST
jgi:hypothetical protein